jgi:hypothetical protein
VMAHAKKTVFMYEQNRQDHIVLQQIWGGRQYSSLERISSVLECLIMCLLTLLSCFHLTPPSLYRFVPSHSNQALHLQRNDDTSMSSLQLTSLKKKDCPSRHVTSSSSASDISKYELLCVQFNESHTVHTYKR